MRILAVLTTFFGSVNAFIRGISLFGMETEYMAVMCTWEHPIDWHMSKIKELDFTHVRVPFSYDYIARGDWTAMDELFVSAERHNLSLALDFHRIDRTHQSAKPYTTTVTFDMFLEAWRTILNRYHSRAVLEAVDIFNEYQSDNAAEWNNLARQIVSFIDTNFPDRFIFYVGGTNWGGSLQFVDLDDMKCHDRIRYTIHKYWFSDTQEPLEQAWNVSFGSHKMLVNVGEWGFQSEQQSQVDWANRFINWLLSVDIKDSYFWTWTWNSGDTGGILKDCTTVDDSKMSILRRYWYPPRMSW